MNHNCQCLFIFLLLKKKIILIKYFQTICNCYGNNRGGYLVTYDIRSKLWYQFPHFLKLLSCAHICLFAKAVILKLKVLKIVWLICEGGQSEKILN